MRARFLISLLVIALAGVAHAGDKPGLADLAWIAGCWDGSSGEDTYNEHWLKPAGDAMFGVSRTVTGGKTVAFEFMRIMERDGAIYFISKPSGQPEAEFKLIKVADGEAVFENPEHDFPQRVIYRRAADGSLAAAIEGSEGGKDRRIDFPLKRVACE